MTSTGYLLDLTVTDYHLSYSHISAELIVALPEGSAVSAVRMMPDGSSLRLTFVRSYGERELWHVPGLRARGISNEELSRELVCVLYRPTATVTTERTRPLEVAR
ncbi:hypothetical protein AB0L74_30405 [Streptomyces sp. NPDC052020]|uniref:hypothetical protein n=1 Tax=Streptomyces sp. NPDC052020 TaxID=3155677 RepID=UPI0034416467